MKTGSLILGFLSNSKGDKMILKFDYTQNLGAGGVPNMVHLPDNTFVAVYFENGLCKRKTTDPKLGLYNDLVWKERGRSSPDEGISKAQLKKVNHYGAYGFWSDISPLDQRPDHKFVMYMLPLDVSKCLNDGSISHSMDNNVSQISIDFVNASNMLVKKNGRSALMPNCRIEIYVALGDSEQMLLGIFNLDNVNIGQPENSVSSSGRNNIGKLLRDQTFDEKYNFEMSLKENIEGIFTLAGVEECFVGDGGNRWKLKFDPEKSLLDGLNEIVNIMPGWQIRENTNGTIGFARMNDNRFDQPGTFVFERDKSCFGYTQNYDDTDTYSRICIKSKIVYPEPAEPPPEPSPDQPEYQYVWVDVEPGKLWPAQAHKTLHVEVPEGTGIPSMTDYGKELAEMLTKAGKVQSFSCVFTPQMIIGDQINLKEINGDISEIGIVTSIRHSFGRSGLHTEFTVDSGGKRGKPQLKDYINQMGAKSKSAAIITEETEVV